MTVIDQSIETPEAVKKKKSFIDLIFVGLTLTLTLIRDVAGIFAIEQMISITGGVVMFCYLLGYWWINKPAVRSARHVIITILYGFSLFAMSCALLFHLLYLPGAQQLTFSGVFLGLVVVAVDAVVSAFTKSITINNATGLRLVMLASLIIGLSFLSQSSRIHFTYRNYPDFLEMYDEQKSNVPFDFIRKEYEKTHQF